MKAFDDRLYAGLQAAEAKAASVVSWPRKPDGLVFHYAMTDYDCSAAEVNQWHKDAGFIPRGSGPYPYMGYHKLIRIDGSIEVGRTDDVIGTHCLGHNDHLFGVCLAGGLQAGWPREAQYRTAVDIARHYTSRFGFGADRLFRHDQLNSTSCPGSFNLHRVVERIQGGATSVRVDVKQYDKPSPLPDLYVGLAVVDLDNVGNFASFEIKFPDGMFSTPPLLLVTQPNTNTHWGANVGTSDVTTKGAKVYVTDRGAPLSGAHIGLGILALKMD
jgi:hypothetical protein